MRIDHRRTDVTVAEQLLNRADIVTIFKQVGCERMTKCVRSRRLTQPGLVNGLFYNFLQNGFMHVVSALFSGNSIGEMASRWKYPLPTPFSPCVRILTFERVLQGDPTQPARPVALVLLLYALEMLGEWFFDRRRQHRVAIFVAFAGAYQYLVGAEIDIFDPQLQTFHQSKASSVEKHHHQPIGMIEDS